MYDEAFSKLNRKGSGSVKSRLGHRGDYGPAKKFVTKSRSGVVARIVLGPFMTINCRH